MIMINVLVVDDSPVACELLSYMLGADPELNVVGTARTAKAALEFVELNKPDVVTMDLHLPDMDGYEATRQMMKNSPVPIVVVTATLPKEDVHGTFFAIDCGALSVIRKPTGIRDPYHKNDAAKLINAVKDAATVKVGFRAAGSW
jgi:two-component system, chemotaxis family, protein-glutamate methylesterase/glutaminase